MKKPSFKYSSFTNDYSSDSNEEEEEEENEQIGKENNVVNISKKKMHSKKNNKRGKFCVKRQLLISIPQNFDF